MLYNITNPDFFFQSIQSVQKSYWPFAGYDTDQKYQTALYDVLRVIEEREQKGNLTTEKVWHRRANITEIISRFMDSAALDMYENVAQNKENSESKNLFRIPFVEKYHNLFSKRRWDPPYTKFGSSLPDLLRLKPEDRKSQDEEFGNYSASDGNYHHFVNVVAALAHLIHFFSNTVNLSYFADKFSIITDRNIDIWSIINFSTESKTALEPSSNIETNNKSRIFKLMLSGYYHDIGKSVVDHRHAMEGYIILSSYQSQMLREFQELGDKAIGKSLTREDLMYIADLVYYHDLYGTLSTGENGYLRLINLIERMEHHARKNSNDLDRKDETIFENGIRCLFDVWLLNVADILVSVKKKWDLQETWLGKKPGDSDEEIKVFFKPPKDKKEHEKRSGNFIDQGDDLLHDFKITVELFDVYLKDQFNTHGLDFRVATRKASHYHDIARIRRLIKNSLFEHASKIADKPVPIFENFNIESDAAKKRTDDLGKILRGLFKSLTTSIDRYAMDKTIETAVKSSTDYTEFCRRLSCVGQLDYSLGFFRKLAEEATKQVAMQVCASFFSPKANVKIEHTGWINDRSLKDWITQNLTPGKEEDWDKKYSPPSEKDIATWCSINARYFLDNYVATVVNILNYLLFRESLGERIQNFEFKDAQTRLTDDKISRILMFEGPSRATISSMLILDTVFIY